MQLFRRLKTFLDAQRRMEFVQWEFVGRRHTTTTDRVNVNAQWETRKTKNILSQQTNDFDSFLPARSNNFVYASSNNSVATTFIIAVFLKY